MTRPAALVLLADGARADVFERLLAAGELPEIARHVVERGGYRRATSTFTSTTGPAHVPFVTGCFCGTADVPGYRWLDRGRYDPRLPAGPWCLRSYNGPEAYLWARDLSPDVSTLFELAANPFDVFGVVTRGVPAGAELLGRTKTAVWPWAHWAHDYALADGLAARGMATAISRGADLAFVVFPGIDWHSHYVDAEGPGALEGYRRVDRAVGAAARMLARRGTYDETLIAVCSDHGHDPVHAHLDLPGMLETELGWRTVHHSWPVLRRHPDAVVGVSGNGMAHVYLPSDDGWGRAPGHDELVARAPELLSALLAQPAVDIVLTRDGAGVRVRSRRGEATLHETPGGVDYAVSGAADPFGLPPLPRRMTHDEALRATADGGHPDALVQAAQLFRSARTGDVVVSATPGWDLRERFERPEHRSSHGALHAAHMSTPLAISVPLADGPLRTADVFSTVIAHLGIAPPAVVDGVDRRAGAPPVPS